MNALLEYHMGLGLVHFRQWWREQERLMQRQRGERLSLHNEAMALIAAHEARLAARARQRYDQSGFPLEA